MARVKFKALLYEFHHDYEIYTGTTKEIAEQLGFTMGYISSHSDKIGVRWAKLKCVDNLSGEVVYGNIEDIALHCGFGTTHITALVNGTRQQKRYSITFTGQYIMEMFNEDKSGVVKPKTDYTSVKPVYSHKPVPMSRYAQELLEWSTRHLRRDA